MSLTSYIAIYAAVLSTSIFLWNIGASKPRLKLQLMYGLDDKGGESVFGVYVILKNPSQHTVHVRSIGLLYPSRKVSLKNHLYWIVRFRRIRRYMQWVYTSSPFSEIDTGLPISIGAHESHSIFLDEDSLKTMLEDARSTRFAAVAQDALGKDTYCRSIDLYPGPLAEEVE